MGKKTLFLGAVALALLLAVLAGLASLSGPDDEPSGAPAAPLDDTTEAAPPADLTDPAEPPVMPEPGAEAEASAVVEEERPDAAGIPEAGQPGSGAPGQVMRDVAVRDHREAELEIDPVTSKPIVVEPGHPPPLEVGRLAEDGLDSVVGTVELTGDRKPELEEGTPVGLTGRVVEKESGLPVPRAHVVVRSAFYTRVHFYDHHLREVARVETDEDGEFRIERLNVEPVHFGEGGLVYLSVESPDHAPLPAIPLTGVTSGYRNRLAELTVTRETYTVRGRVIDRWEGKPVVDAQIVATGEILPIQYPKDQREALFLSAPSATTDEEGRFVLENVGPGKQTICVNGGNDCAGYLEVTVPAKGEITIASRQIRGRIEGKVVDDRERPIPLVRIDGGENTTHTFADGGFVLENFRGDVVTLSFSHPDYRPLSKAGVADGTKELLVPLASRWPEIYFRVRDHRTNDPLKKIEVHLQAAEGTEVPPLPASPFYVAKQGRHAVRLPAGYTSAKITAKGYEETVVDLSQARADDVIEIVLRRK